MRYLWGLGIGAIAIFSFVYPAAAFEVSPEAITLTGDRTRQLSATLTLSDNQGIRQLNTAISDLRRADGAALIPANRIKIDPNVIQITPHTPQQIKLTLDFSTAIANGEFAGSLYLYHARGQQTIPVLVRVKAGPVLPWVVMLLGVAFGTGLSSYRAEGRSRDEIIVQIGRLRNQMRGDDQLEANFKTSIEAELVDVESALADKDWQTATTQIVEAKQLWIRWQKGREDWIAQLQYGQKLVSDHYQTLLPEIQNTLYMQEVRENLECIYRRLRTGQYQSPQDLSTAFSDIRRQIDQYNQADATIQQLKQRRRELAPERANFWQTELDWLESSLQKLRPDQASFDAWKNSLNDQKTKLEAEIREWASQASNPSVAMITGRAANVDELVFSPISSVPQISSRPQPDRFVQAAQKLKWFNLTSQA